MKLLFAATPAPGHLNPLLTIARMAVERGHEVLLATGTYLKPAVEAAGVAFAPLEAGADLDLTRTQELWPDIYELPPGPEQLRVAFGHGFLDTIPAQAATLRLLVQREQPDVILVDDFFFGASALYLDQSTPRPPIIACGSTVMVADRPDGAPTMLGLPPATDAETRTQYSAIAKEVEASFAGPVRDAADAKLAEMGLPPLPCSLLHSRHVLVDAFLQLTVPEFEYDFGGLPDHVHFVGALPPAPLGHIDNPDWWNELDGDRRIVLVTQGTVANADFGELIEPTLQALADRDDLLVLVTTGKRPLDQIRGPIPSNARLATFLDFAALLPKVDVLVTNGGYGTVGLALQAGVPIVAAGRTEDKAEVGAHVAWSGVGVEIPAQRPDAASLREAVDRVLNDDRYGRRAFELSEAFAATDTPTLIFNVIEQVVAADQGRERDRRTIELAG